MLKFMRACEDDREVLKDLCRDSIHGTEVFTFLSAHSGSIEENFWCGKNENGVIKTLIFNDGDDSFLIFGDEYPCELVTGFRHTMIYKAKSCELFSEPKELCNSRIAGFYKTYSGLSDMSFDDKARYVHVVHCKNKDLCRFFGITENGKLIAVSAVTAMNEKYALIGNVFTHMDYRDRGLAKKCISKCIEFSLLRGKTPFLCCMPHMVNYYKRLGFELINE